MKDTYPKYKAAAVQDHPIFLNRKASAEKACRLMMEASKNGAKLVAFPEIFVPGYPYWIWLDTPNNNYSFFKKLFEESVTIPGPITDELCRGAKEADVYVVIGVNEKLPTQMGTMWNTNLIIDNTGKILGKHRKIVPTFAEKMIHSFGDGSGLKVWETDIGRLGTLCCGNNTHSLYKYSLIAQGEQVHVANYPSFFQTDQANQKNWIRTRTAAHSLEGKLFTVTSTNTISPEMFDILCGDDEKKRKILESCCAYSCICNPLGNELAGVENTETIIYAEIDISDMIQAKQYHDIVGHYTRMDVVSLNLCQDEDKPIHFITKGLSSASSGYGSDLLKEVQRQINSEISNQLKNITDLISNNTSRIEDTKS